LQSPLSVTDFLFGATAASGARAAGAAKPPSCPRCHMTAGDFQKSNRLGCGACYVTFEDDLVPMIESMQRALQHVGRRPASEVLRAELTTVREQLVGAVHRQAFEEAAALRDRVHALESRIPGGADGR